MSCSFPSRMTAAAVVVLGAGNVWAVCSAITTAPHEYFYRRGMELRGAHLLQTRTKVLNDELDEAFNGGIRNSDLDHKYRNQCQRLPDPRPSDALHLGSA